jgi:hypothetical protein
MKDSKYTKLGLGEIQFLRAQRMGYEWLSILLVYQAHCAMYPE